MMIGVRLLLAAVLGLAPLAASALNMKAQGEYLFLSGEIDTPDLRKLQRALQQNPQVRTLVLLTIPGSNDDETNAEMIYLIRSRGLNTHLTRKSRVESGGTDLFLAGVRRTMERGARVGVHSWADDYGEGRAYPRGHEAHELFLDLYADIGIPAAFYWFTLAAAPARGMHYMSEAELRKYRVVNTPIR